MPSAEADSGFPTYALPALKPWALRCPYGTDVRFVPSSSFNQEFRNSLFSAAFTMPLSKGAAGCCHMAAVGNPGSLDSLNAELKVRSTPGNSWTPQLSTRRRKPLIPTQLSTTRLTVSATSVTHAGMCGSDGVSVVRRPSLM